MRTQIPNLENSKGTPSLSRVARLPGFRALAWAGDTVYASRRYELLRARISLPFQVPTWESVATFAPGFKRGWSARFNLTARLFRDGFHALAVLQSGSITGAVPGAIVTRKPGEREFRQTFKIMRGKRPLHITSVPGGIVFWGEYFDNPARDEVHIYGSHDAGETWSSAYIFPKGAIRHVHNIVFDPWADCLWVLTGDYGNECCILRASFDLSQMEVVIQGNQQARAVAAIPMQDGLYFSTDTPLEQNFIYRLDRNGTLTKLTTISSSSIYACRVGQHSFFSTMVEPSEANRDRRVRVYAAKSQSPEHWNPVLDWTKDIWPMGLFQYGNAFLPDGNNETSFLAVTTAAVRSDDITMALYAID